MRLLVGSPLRVPVELVFVNHDLLQSRNGWVRWYDGEQYEIETEFEPPLVRPGFRVVINFRDVEPMRVVAHVCEARGSRLLLHEHRVASRNKRLFPRMCGGIPLRYHIVEPAQFDALGSAWTARRVDPTQIEPWRCPDSFMSFSVMGLMFEDHPCCQVDDRLLIELGVGQRAERWRGTARVVRIEPTPVQEVVDQTGSATHQIAISFLEIPQAARFALEDFTLQIQRACTS